MLKLRLLWLVLILLLHPLCALSQRTNQAYWSYIDKYKGWAIEQMEQYRIPASITLAQGLLESNAGRSTLATKANNHFGIKVGTGWTGPYVLRDDDRKNEKFRKYKSARESYIDHSKFLQGKRYQSLFSLKITDYKGWARGLKAAGYATNPQYANQLINVIEMYNLSQFDTKKKKSHLKTTKADKSSNTGTGGYNFTLPSTPPVTYVKVAGLTMVNDEFIQNHKIYKNNRNYFLIVEVGDNMATISKKTGLSLRQLYQYNDLPRDYAPTQGDLIYLKKKRKCASREFRKKPIHRVEVNQSMHDISQLYGIRLEYLYKLNQMSPDHQIQPGEILRIR